MNKQCYVLCKNIMFLVVFMTTRVRCEPIRHCLSSFILDLFHLSDVSIAQRGCPGSGDVRGFEDHVMSTPNPAQETRVDLTSASLRT